MKHNIPKESAGQAPNGGEGSGRTRSGQARMAKLSKEERSALAKKAAKSRWLANEFSSFKRATHYGEIHLGSKMIPCAVLEDGTRVITQTGFLRAMGKAGGAKNTIREGVEGFEKVPPFLRAHYLQPYISDELRQMAMPIAFTLPGSNVKAWGYRAELLPQVCTLYLQARDAGALLLAQLPLAESCDLLIRSLAHVGIIALIDEATGYQTARDQLALQEILDKFIGKELAKWVRRFPADFYERIFKLRNWKYDPNSTKRPVQMAQITADLVYARLAPGVLDELRRLNPKDENGHRKNRHHQWLTPDVGHPVLRDHITGLIYLGKVFDSWDGFYVAVNKAMPKYGNTLTLPFPDQD